MLLVYAVLCYVAPCARHPFAAVQVVHQFNAQSFMPMYPHWASNKFVRQV